MTVHTLAALEATRVPGQPDYMLLSLSGEDGSHERFVVGRDTLQQIAEALAAHLERERHVH